MNKKEEAEKAFDKKRRETGLRAMELYYALKYRGTEGFKKKIIAFTINKPDKTP